MTSWNCTICEMHTWAYKRNEKLRFQLHLNNGKKRLAARHVARNFDRGANKNQLSAFKCIMPLVFQKTSSTKCALFWHLFFWIVLFWFNPANRKSAFIELTSFKSLFLVNFQISTLNESHHFLVKLSCKSVCENNDAISARSTVCFIQPILQLSKESSWQPLWLRFLCLHA